MPDHDPKNIPTLDDIIEDEDFNVTDIEHTARNNTVLNADINTATRRAEAAIETDDINLDLFLDEATEQPSDFAAASADINNHDANASPVFDVSANESLKVALDPAELEKMVESVVKKLLPDLEQQLQTLLLQTLKDKLCKEVNTLLENETGQDKNSVKAE